MLVGGPVVPQARTAPAPSPAPLPADFSWGVASSGFQSEGSSPDSNWTRYIRAGRTHEPIGTSVDFRHRYADDIRLAARLGTRVYRVGVEWARLEPRPGVVDPTAMRYYDAVVDEIRAQGMRPMITIDHWVYPGWVADRGGWADARTPGWWLRNARRVVDHFADRDPLWVTINEPTAYVMQELRMGGIAPARVPAMLDGLVAVHRAIYDHIHRRQPNAMVTSNAAYIPAAESVLDTGFLDRVRDKLDFVGIDYYYSVSPARSQTWRVATDEPWAAPVAADGLYYALRYFGRRHPGKPLYVVEAGMPTRDGAARPDHYRRADHLRDEVYWLQRARADGLDVIGYNYWSLTDNYEWGSYTTRFGLYTVDIGSDRSLTRRPTDAVAAYRSLIRGNGVPGGYRPTRPAEVCSLVDAPTSCTQPVR
ncbi:putative beta-glucosidase [Gordonia soli NBRC 108243]|uniref:Putative beta-glucosidase n=1 Tax=Gordonia soli NBRC 108243 TaxID=1223545 RepID=M0QPT4_9ACTN|nr:putative beta-glucosidase [Gordonia soli NBRC 108243]